MSNQTLPESVNKIVSMRDAFKMKIEELKQNEAKMKKARLILENQLAENDKLLIELHHEHGDFEIGGYKVKKRVSYETVIKDESKLPKDCFVVKTTVSKTKVKEHIIDGNISPDVAYQQKNESISIS